VTQVSHCPGQNAEVETATSAPHYVYDLWIGCGGIGFARSTDGGPHWRTTGLGTLSASRTCPAAQAPGWP